MKKIIFAALALAIAAGASAQTQENRHENVVQVSGKAEKKFAPDEIYIDITIKDGDIKNQNVNQIESKLKSELKAMGIDVEKSLKVKSMANAPRKRSQVDTSRSYELKLSDVWTMGAVFELLGEMGISNASLNRVSHSRMDEFRREVRVEAVKSARDNARLLAEAIGQSIGPAVWILDSGNIYEAFDKPVMTRANMMMAKDSVYAEGTAETGLEFKEITLTYNVTAKFILNAE